MQPTVVPKPQRIGVPREIFPGEKRVATVPDVVEKLIKLGFTVAVESGAGEAANFDDDAYRTAGAEIIDSAAALWATSDIVLKVRPPSDEEVVLMREGGLLIDFIWPAQNPELMRQLAAKSATVLAIDCLPRTLSRAQKMDALTSTAGVSGYRAVIEAANAFGRYFNGQITAAGKVPPAKVFIAGAGVAGLAAIGTAANLGAIVRANDTRAEVADQVKSLGGEFVTVDYDEDGAGGGGYAKVMSEGFRAAQREMYAQQAKDVDIIITTALIPGKPAPTLITDKMVQSMKSGSVIVDMAAEQGGNCELTVPGESVVRHGVTIIGYTDLPSRLAKQSSTLYATNLLRLAEDLCKAKDGVAVIDMEDDAIRGLTVIKNGSITWPAPPLKVAPAAAPRSAALPAVEKKSGHAHGSGAPLTAKALTVIFAIAVALFWGVGTYAPAAFLGHFTVFVLACFIGYMVVWNVAPALHTPLMSVTNAISSIIAIGSLVQIAPPAAGSNGRLDGLIFRLAFAALVLTAVNMFGGFAVTRRMLSMFRK
ncbi:NAD(P)(+) transhydrogenase (Re/Si-specific) subunit alpha [Trinickia symbiotica]|uniref:NAD(P) transhydrogenase subunit alpha n=1 Tax=Trinickia symbiotica TaxID=863227 RepID=A0A2T3XRZ6_9BURK|nr:Re/Si-specific NAD(P)(+) transhydrogenase subunit alpha [Trinickia symbiotica]PTB19274.1 NAD(P)(+) transhydrogenase (Re/Si-specific) subunit alpha [Trinickia symbiotica]